MAGKDHFAMFQVHFIYSWWAESKRAWYLLFVYVHNYSLPIESLGTGGPRRRPGNESGYGGPPEEAWERVWVRGGPGGGLGMSLGTGGPRRRPGNESGYGGGPRRRPGNESGYGGAQEEAWERVWVRGGPGGGLGTSLGTGGPRRRPGNESGYGGAQEEAWERVWVRG